MYSRSTFLSLLLLLVPLQNPDDSFQRHYENAETQRRAGNLGAAEAEYLKILGEAYHKLARVYSAQADYRGSVIALETTAGYLPDSAEVLVDLAIAYFHTQEYEKAVEPLSKALVRDPRSTAAHHMLGKTYFMLGKFEKSTSELETALNLAPKDYDVAYTLGLAYLKERKVVAARQLYDRMIEQLGNRPQLRVLIGRAYAWGLGAAGGAGVARAIEILTADLHRTLRLLGCPSLGELEPSMIELPADFALGRRTVG